MPDPSVSPSGPDHASTSPSPTDPSTAGPPVKEYRGTGVFWVLAAIFVPLVLLIVMLAQNSGRVPFRFLWWDLNPPLYVIMLVTAAAAAALTEAAAAMWRHQRRRVRTERSELAALRSSAAQGGVVSH